LALEYFQRSKVDIAIIETGLGGRLDATNVLDPLLTLTTDISLDHVEILGPTIRKIAYEKAGIIKPETPHLVGELPSPAEKVIRQVCKKKKAPFTRLNKSDYKIYPEELKLDFHYDRLSLENISPALIGVHQLKNSALVIKALAILKDRYGLKISKTAVRKGLRAVQWPGRFQVIKNNGSPTIVLDVCHNKAGVRAFVDSFKLKYPGRKARLITGFVKRKPHQAIFNALSEITDEYFLVPLNTRRSTDIGELLREINWRNITVKKYGNLDRAYLKVLNSARPDDIINIIGSHFLVGEYLKKYIWK